MLVVSPIAKRLKEGKRISRGDLVNEVHRLVRLVEYGDEHRERLLADLREADQTELELASQRDDLLRQNSELMDRLNIVMSVASPSYKVERMDEKTVEAVEIVRDLKGN